MTHKLRRSAFHSLALLSLMGSAAGCKKFDDPHPMPACIEDQLKVFKRQKPMTGHSLQLYRFQGADAYLFETDPDVADGTSEVMDANCNTLGYLGGIMGNVMINGEVFCSQAELVEVIWER